MPTFTKRITANGDDGRLAGGATFVSGDSGVFMFRFSDGNSQDVFLRFTNVTIPNGASITSAKITFVSFETRTETVTRSNITGNDVDDAVAPTNATEYNNLVDTTASVAWDGEGTWTAETTHDTPDFATIVQEIVDRGGWASGQDMQFMIKNDASDTGAYRRFYGHEGDTAKAALLTIEYVTDVTINKSLAYAVLTDASITKSLKYTVVEAASAITKSLQYAILSDAAITKSLTYAVSSTVAAITKSLKYTVLDAGNAITKSLQYDVVSSSSVVIQKGLIYAVITTKTAIQKSLTYNVLPASQTITKSLQYAINTSPAITKALAYFVVVPTSITKSLKYAIQKENIISKTLQYIVTGQIIRVGRIITPLSFRSRKTSLKFR